MTRSTSIDSITPIPGLSIQNKWLHTLLFSFESVQNPGLQYLPASTPIVWMEGRFGSFLHFYNVNCWQLCLLTHYQVQLSEKDWTAWGWVLHSLLFLETSIQPTQMLFTIVQWRVNPHLLPSSCSCCIKQNFPFPIPPPHFFAQAT